MSPLRYSRLNLLRELIRWSLHTGGMKRRRGHPLTLRSWFTVMAPGSRKRAWRELAELPTGSMPLCAAGFLLLTFPLFALRQWLLPPEWGPPILFVSLTFVMLPPVVCLCWSAYVSRLVLRSDLAGIRARLSRPLDGVLLAVSVVGVVVAVVVAAVVFLVGGPEFWSLD